ncbi:acetyl-CoA sensor PanZ family protein [Halomonas sp. HNIBRBA4712]|uniref:acetyl-CoA sensor PanZ family protein n=1 Tax=Halomonas sp. HNIBRBA4712 TaxID=3373087 RepID=UPI003744E739
MAVTLVYVDRSRWGQSASIRQDLTRIYDDAFAERIGGQAAAPFIEDHLAEKQFFACARFDARLLGAVAIFEADDRAWWLSELCVRESARRRGVGSRLMALLAEQAGEQKRTLRIDTAALPLADRILLSRIGYRPRTGETGEHGFHEYVELDPQGNG